MSTSTSSSKRKWDDPDEQLSTSTPTAKVAKTDDTKTANDAAAAAAAIAAKIAAQFASGNLGTSGEGDYTQDIDINDVRNRYMLTKSTTQQQINEETGASVSTKGVWYPDRSRATERDPPLHLHLSATSPQILQKAIDRVNELLNVDLGSLTEDKNARLKERRRWPEEKLPIGLDSIRNFNIRAKVVGPQGLFVKYIQQETGARVQIKGLGSGFVDQETGKESDEPLYIHITCPEEEKVARAKVLTEDLLLVVRAEHAKAMQVVQQQQMELHQAQMQYAAYSGYAPPQAGEMGAAAAPAQGEAPQDPAAQQAAFEQYWAAYGYDVNSQQFKEWAASQQGQWGQQQQQQAQQPGAGGGEGQPPPPPPPPSGGGDAQPPPPPPPA